MIDDLKASSSAGRSFFGQRDSISGKKLRIASEKIGRLVFAQT
jgi:hypothetical protein